MQLGSDKEACALIMANTEPEGKEKLTSRMIRFLPLVYCTSTRQHRLEAAATE